MQQIRELREYGLQYAVIHLTVGHMLETVKSLISRVSATLATLLQWLSALILVVIAAAVGWQVLGRYVTSAPGAWAQELASYSFVWLAMFAVALGVREGAHMTLDAWGWLPPESKLNKTLNHFSLAVVLVVIVVIGYYGVVGLETAFTRKVPGLQMSYGWVALAIPVGMGLSAFFTLEQWCRVNRKGATTNNDCGVNE